MFLTAMLAVDAILHFVILGRFGIKGNEPPLVFGIAYAVLAAAAVYGAAFVPWAALIVAVIGTVGLAANYRRIPHEKGIERLILGLNVLLILYLAATIFLR